MYNVTQDSTQHGKETPYGWSTPHRLPTRTSTTDELISMVRELYPTGRAFRVPENSNIENFHRAVNASLLQAINDAYATINSTFPDNDNFTAEDCTLWEYRYGLITNESLSLPVRRQAIRRKMGFRGLQRPRQAPSYIQNQLNQAGFMVGIYENPFRLTPEEVLQTSTAITQHGGGTQHGVSTQHGSANFQVIANKITDEDYNIGGAANLWATFFIAGINNLNEFGQVPLNRKDEFRELILKLKPAHTVGFLMINFV